MFVRDKDLRRGGGDERARVLQLAKEQRVARSQQKEHDATARCLQAFVRGRLTAQRTRAHLRSDVDHKLADIAQLKLLLQRRQGRENEKKCVHNFTAIKRFFQQLVLSPALFFT